MGSRDVEEGQRRNQQEEVVGGPAVARSDSFNQSDLTAQKNPAKELLRKHRKEFELAAELASRLGSMETAESLGADLEPMWFTDTSVLPGKDLSVPDLPGCDEPVCRHGPGV